MALTYAVPGLFSFRETCCYFFGAMPTLEIAGQNPENDLAAGSTAGAALLDGGAG